MDQETNTGEGATVTQPAKDESCNSPDMKSDSELGPASGISMDIDTDIETDRLSEKEKSEDTDKKEMRSNSPESVDNAPDDQSFKGGDEKSTKSESVGYTKVRRGERSKHNVFKELGVGKPTSRTVLWISKCSQQQL